MMALTSVLLLFIATSLTGAAASVSRDHAPGANLTTPELIEMNGYPAETHHVTTEDGYILELHRIPHGINDTFAPGRPVAYLQHCLLCSSADWLMDEPSKALGYMLADLGYDVWLGNYRGNTYSRNHVSLDPDDGIDFWSFSWDEMGIIDLPTMIDYVLDTTGQTDVYYVGFSMGTTTYMALMSEKPEYNNKIRVAALMAPAIYMTHVKGVVAYLAPYSNDIDTIMTLLGQGELLPSSNVTDEWVELYCDQEQVTAEICYNLLFLICGPDPDLINKEYLPVMLAHTPAGTSIHTLNHYAQLVLAGGFRMYDYGLLGNQNHYGQNTPPDYNLTNLLAPVAIWWGPNDWLATPEDIALMTPNLPNLILNQRVNFDLFNHLDFVWAINAHELVYYQLIDILADYGGPSRN